MCPLRIILIFLSATLAGFFVLRNIKSTATADAADDDDGDAATAINSPEASSDSPNSLSLVSQVKGVIGKGFWAFVDMASGRYLWRVLLSSSSASSSSQLKPAD